MFAAIFALLWVGWAVSWFAAAAWSSPAVKRAGLAAGLAYRIVIAAGSALFLIPAHGYYGWMRLWLVTWNEAWVCVGLTAAGLAFAWWARIYLGNLWSGSVVTKGDHRVVDTGPYRIVRHPIYSGLLLATYATMAAKGTLTAIAGAALITLGVWMKARLEEKFLRQELGPDTYDAYAKRVKMLLPLVGP